ncbi:hypothetical protein CHS0354_033372 [Potamilus streckersoni]|uniref:W2 domain-containing protein n=1 Tax=Potamilus streckersoni TaxID=2493646 RepID=A0AAE0RTD4_9BIVA|nr:hypothetical protein CHS0354_033372 [Potamilus streckersoni]
MSQKAEKPSLSGQRLKTRKRDEKEKYDPSSFRDAIIQGLNETGGDLELVSKFLDISGSKLDYRRYAEVLFDILFAGGQLAPGGSIVEEQDETKVYRTDICVFAVEESKDSLKAFYEVFVKLIRRYKYLERSFEEVIKKLFLFLKGFQDDAHQKFAIILGIMLANSFLNPKALSNLFEDHLSKDGTALRFATVMFRIWLEEKDIASLVGTLKKAQLDTRLLELFPMNKRSQEAFVSHFKQEGLEAIADFQDKQQTAETKKELQKKLSEMIKDEEQVKDVIIYVTEHAQKNELVDLDVVILVWNTLMSGMEWNKKEELVAAQALKHLKTYCPLLHAVAKTPNAELRLIVKIQEFCYDNMNFMNVFQKIVVLLYKTEVLSEDVILKWYKESHSAKGKSVFLAQMKNFIEWLENAEEESEEEDD